MDKATADYLVSDEGAALLAETASLPGDTAARVLTLRKRGVTLPVASGAVDVAEARHRARFRFSDAARLFFTADALAQATSPLVAAYHASHLSRFETVADLGCGVGMDAVCLAGGGRNVIAIEQDPARLVFACANARVRGVAEKISFVEGDVTTLDWSADALYWDPSRRENDRRVSRHADRYEPPLTFLETARKRVRGGCLKLSPALPDEVLGELNGAVAFLSENRECKEACLLFGAAADDTPAPFTAVLLPEERVVPSSAEPAPVGSLGQFLHDPDPALIRADALGTIARSDSLRLISPDDSYLTSDVPLLTPRFASTYRLIEAMPYKPRILGDFLRARGVGRLVVKKRHFPKEPDAVARELGLRGGAGEEATLILVREGKGHLALLCEPYYG